MAICTYSDVFEFVGTPDDVETSQQTAVTNLITRVETEIEATIGRKIASTSMTNVIFQNGLNCEILGNELYLKGVYRDTYSISSIYENGVALTAVAAYSDGNGYMLDSKKGLIIRAMQDWSTEEFAIKISGSYGLGGASVNQEIKQIAIETVAARSGLWKQNVVTEGGTIQTIRTTPRKETTEALKKYMLRDV